MRTPEEIIDYLSGNTEPFDLPTIIYSNEPDETDDNLQNQHQYFRDDIVWKAMEEYRREYASQQDKKV